MPMKCLLKGKDDTKLESPVGGGGVGGVGKGYTL